MREMQNDMREMQNLGDTTEWTVSASEYLPLTANGIRYFGISDAGPGYSFARKRPSFGAVFITLGGRGLVWTANGWENSSPGETYLTPPLCYHAYKTVPDSRWDVGWFAIEAPVGEKCRVEGKEPASRPARVEGLGLAMRGFHQEFTGSRSLTHLNAWHEVIFAELERVIRSDWQIDPRLAKVWKEVDAAPDRPWTLRSLSRMASLSGEQFRALCQKTFRGSPMERVAELRMRRARQLLLRSDMSISEIAGRVGYGNQFSFSAAFKRRVRLTPSEYRKTND